MIKNKFGTKRGRFGTVTAALLALTLVFVTAESASAKTGDFGIRKSVDEHAVADSNYNGPGVSWVKGGTATVKGTLYDVSADGKGATIIAYANFYTASNNFYGQRSDEARELDGSGTHKSVTLTVPWVSGASRATLYVYVCNGKDANGGNLSCGSQYTISVS